MKKNEKHLKFANGSLILVGSPSKRNENHIKALFPEIIKDDKIVVEFELGQPPVCYPNDSCRSVFAFKHGETKRQVIYMVTIVKK